MDENGRDGAGSARGSATNTERVVADPARLAALWDSGLLDRPPGEAFDRLTRLATAILRVPVAFVSLVDADRRVFASSVGLPEPWASARQIPLSYSFCQHTMAAREPLLIEDAREHPLVRDNLATTDLGVVAYAGIPLITSNGHALGSFCVLDGRPRAWTEAEVAILTDLAAAVMTEIELGFAAREAREARAQAEEARAQAEARARQLEGTFEAMTDGVVLYDALGRALALNGAMRALLGLDPADDYAAQPFHERADRLHLCTADGIPLPADAWPAARLLRGETLSGEGASDLLIHALDGHERIISVSGAPLRDATGAAHGAVAVYRDVTERRRLERLVAAERDRLQQVVDVLPGGVLIADAEGRVALANRVARDVFGPDLVGQPLPAEDQEREAHERYEARYGDGPLVLSGELPLRRSLGGEVVRGARIAIRHAGTGGDTPFLFNSAPLYDAKSALAGAVAVFQDISDIQSMERAREEFLSSASHDLKTPLTSIRGQAQLARRRLARLASADGADGADVTPIDGSLARIDVSTGRMLALINELVDLTRARLGTSLELDRQPTDLVALVGAAAAQYEGPDARRIVVESAEPALWATVDAARLGRVVDNVLSNALKFSPGGGEVRVRLSREPSAGADGSVAAIAVTDRGVGVPAADLPHIFERFQRAGNVAGRIEGTGVGLASARHIVEQHGGSIAVESVEGAGSTFTVRLPLTPETAG